MAKTYWEKLKDPRWQKRRLEVLQHYEWACQLCFGSETTLHVHHKAYFKGRDPWDYELDQLTVLCEDCHAYHHESEDPYALVGSYLPIDGPCGRRDAAVLILGAMRDQQRCEELVARCFNDGWPFLPFQLAIGQTATAIEYAVGWDTSFKHLLRLPAAIEEAPERFKRVIVEFVESIGDTGQAQE